MKISLNLTDVFSCPSIGDKNIFGLVMDCCYRKLELDGIEAYLEANSIK